MDDAADHSPATRLRLEAGHDVLDTWSQTADQARRNVVYAALFALQDGSLLRNHCVVQDSRRPDEITVVFRDGMTMRIRILCADSFGIVSIDQAEPPAGR